MWNAMKVKDRDFSRSTFDLSGDLRRVIRREKGNEEEEEEEEESLAYLTWQRRNGSRKKKRGQEKNGASCARDKNLREKQ